MGQMYMIVGRTGVNDGSPSWNVCSYLEEEDAKEHLRAVTDAANRLLEPFWTGHGMGKPFLDVPKYEKAHGQASSNPYDLNMRVSAHGVFYSMETVPFRAGFK